ncbi:MAG: hypothetical protein NVS2B12_26760 [Ktedonobacteraceae bacterium]
MMKKKILLTIAMNALFASAQLTLLPVGGVHATPHYAVSATSKAESVPGASLAALLSARKKGFVLSNSEGISDIQELQKFVSDSFK